MSVVLVGSGSTGFFSAVVSSEFLISTSTVAEDSFFISVLDTASSASLFADLTVVPDAAALWVTTNVISCDAVIVAGIAVLISAFAVVVISNFPESVGFDDFTSTVTGSVTATEEPLVSLTTRVTGLLTVATIGTSAIMVVPDTVTFNPVAVSPSSFT